jgi:hypothetical protein
MTYPVALAFCFPFQLTSTVTSTVKFSFLVINFNTNFYIETYYLDARIKPLSKLKLKTSQCKQNCQDAFSHVIVMHYWHY